MLKHISTLHTGLLVAAITCGTSIFAAGAEAQRRDRDRVDGRSDAYQRDYRRSRERDDRRYRRDEDYRQRRDQRDRRRERSNRRSYRLPPQPLYSDYGYRDYYYGQRRSSPQPYRYGSYYRPLRRQPNWIYGYRSPSYRYYGEASGFREFGPTVQPRFDYYDYGAYGGYR